MAQIVTTGRREKRRRRARRTALTSLTAAVALCRVAVVAQTVAQPSRSPGALSEAGVPSASSTAHVLSVEPTLSGGKSAGAVSTVAEFLFPTSVSESSASVVEQDLREHGYAHLTMKSATSSTVAPGNAIDILDAQNRSVLGTQVAVDTPLTVLASIGPAH